MGKKSITLSMELAKTQCYEFECLMVNYSLTSENCLAQQFFKVDPCCLQLQK